MKTLLLLILLQVSSPQYEFKSTSSYLDCTQNHPNTEYNNNSYKTGPRKVSGLGWITWLTWGLFNGVPSSATNEDMYAYYDYIQAGGTLSYQNWYNYRYNVPLKDETLVLYLCVLVYMSLKKIKQQKNRDVPYITKLSKNVYLEKIDK